MLHWKLEDHVRPGLMSTRRELLSGAGATISLLLVGCGPSSERRAANAQGPATAEARPERLAMIVHRDPGCGCCEAWADLARRAGYEVALQDETDMPAVKRRLGVPASLASCHTAVVANLVFEGHVPLAQVRRLLDARPAGISGLAVPGMPVGSEGMEAPDGRREPYQVLAFDQAGRTSLFFDVA